jgi:hypothetical protein
MWLRAEGQPESIPDHKGIHNLLNRLLGWNKHDNLTIRFYQGVTQFSKSSGLTLFKPIRQFPNHNPIEALRWVVQMAPCPTGRETLSAIPVNTEKHIANTESFHTLGKKHDVFFADRTYIQNLRILPPSKVFSEKTQYITGIIYFCGISVWVLFRSFG